MCQALFKVLTGTSSSYPHWDHHTSQGRRLRHREAKSPLSHTASKCQSIDLPLEAKLLTSPNLS